MILLRTTEMPAMAALIGSSRIARKDRPKAEFLSQITTPSVAARMASAVP